MAKPIGPKTALIREAITANPGIQNKPLAELINSSDARKEDGIKVTPFEIAEQRQRMKKVGAAIPASVASSALATSETTANGKKRGRPKGSGAGKKTAFVEKRAATGAERKGMGAKGGPVELIDRLFELAEDAGGLGALKRLVDRLAPLERA
jgi:hypothetical protein